MTKRITRDITPDRTRDLLERVPRACICFSSDHGPEAWPVEFVSQAGRYFAGLPARAGRRPASGDEVVLLVDDGVRFFDLRAVSIRGHLEIATPPPGAPAAHTWFEVVSIRTGGWDFGALREISVEA